MSNPTTTHVISSACAPCLRRCAAGRCPHADRTKGRKAGSTIGKPEEKVKVEAVDSDNSLNMVDKVKYWRDSMGVHHMPKRKLSDIILNCY